MTRELEAACDPIRARGLGAPGRQLRRVERLVAAAARIVIEHVVGDIRLVGQLSSMSHS